MTDKIKKSKKFYDNTICDCTMNEELRAENEKLKEQIIKLSEENGNLIIRANTCSNNYMDTQRRLDELCKANIHNLALLSKANKTLQKIKRYIAKICKEECGYVQKKRCPDCDCRFGAILDLITKAEEE